MIKKVNINSGNYYKKLSKRKAFICGLKGTKLTKSEIIFLKKNKPYGVILFSRNIKTIDQTCKLTASIKKLFNDSLYPIFIDEEGGRVTRLNKLFDNTSFSSKFFGDLFLKNKRKFYLYLDIYINQVCHILKLLGINCNTVPVLDLNIAGKHNIIGDRSYSSNPKVVSKIGDIIIKKFHENKILTIIKHIPGHGLADVDSHKKLPVVSKSKSYLIKNDFYPFIKKESIYSMTAHVLYKSIDNANCATQSHKIIKIIRNKIKFNNIIMTDDISMKALRYSLKENIKKSYYAGCNIVLHCNANLREMKVVADNSPCLNNFIIKKTTQIYKIIK